MTDTRNYIRDIIVKEKIHIFLRRFVCTGSTLCPVQLCLAYSSLLKGISNRCKLYISEMSYFNSLKLTCFNPFISHYVLVKFLGKRELVVFININSSSDKGRPNSIQYVLAACLRFSISLIRKSVLDRIKIPLMRSNGVNGNGFSTLFSNEVASVRVWSRENVPATMIWMEWPVKREDRGKSLIIFLLWASTTAIRRWTRSGFRYMFISSYACISTHELQIETGWYFVMVCEIIVDRNGEEIQSQKAILQFKLAVGHSKMRNNRIHTPIESHFMPFSIKC